jgi:hypothetical protein
MGRPQFTDLSRRPGDTSIDRDKLDYGEGTSSEANLDPETTILQQEDYPRVLHSVYSSVQKGNFSSDLYYRVRIRDVGGGTLIAWDLNLSDNLDPQRPVPIPPDHLVSIEVVDESDTSTVDTRIHATVAASRVEA